MYTSPNILPKQMSASSLVDNLGQRISELVANPNKLSESKERIAISPCRIEAEKLNEDPVPNFSKEQMATLFQKTPARDHQEKGNKGQKLNLILSNPKNFQEKMICLPFATSSRVPSLDYPAWMRKVH
jgi:hypothetical protein